MNILVTGANGQLGHEMQRVALGSKHHYIFTDVAEGYEQLDITNIDAVRAMVKERNVNVIVNCAAYTNVDKAETDYDFANLLNNTAAGNLATAMKEVDGSLIFLCTVFVFKGLGDKTARRLWQDIARRREVDRGHRMQPYHHTYSMALFAVGQELCKDDADAHLYKRLTQGRIRPGRHSDICGRSC